jgi:hypothetical protein
MPLPLSDFELFIPEAKSANEDKPIGVPSQLSIISREWRFDRKFRSILLSNEPLGQAPSSSLSLPATTGNATHEISFLSATNLTILN